MIRFARIVFNALLWLAFLAMPVLAASSDDVGVAITRVAAITTAGNQVITTPDLLGNTPKGAIILYTVADTDGTLKADALLSVGVTDCTNERVNTTSDLDADASPSSMHKNQLETDIILEYTTAGSATATAQANFVRCQRDGITIEWSNPPASGGFITAVFFAGDDVSAAAGTVTLASATNTVSGLGFTPDLVFVTTNGLLMNQHGFSNGISYGWGKNDATDLNYGIFFAGDTTDSPTNQRARMMTSNSLGLSDGNSGTLFTALVDNYVSGGFDVVPNAVQTNRRAAYLALDLGVTDVHLGVYDPPTSSGSDADTGAGFDPQFVFLGMTNTQTADTLSDGPDGGAAGITVFDGDDIFSVSRYAEDGVTTTNTASLSDDILNFDLHDQTAAFDATFTSFDASGFTLNYSAADGTQRRWFQMAVEEGALTAIFFGAIVLAFGTGIFKPGVQGTLVKATNRKNSTMAWAVFYQTVNIGGFLGPLVAAQMRQLEWEYVFYVNAAIISLNFLLLLAYKEPGKEERLAARAEMKERGEVEAPLWREALKH